MQLPITSRIKRSPLFNTDPKDPKATRGGSEPGEDVEVTETVDTPETMEPVEDICGPDDMREECVKLRKMTPEEIRKSEIKSGRRVEASTKEVTTTEKGEDLDYEGTLMQETEGRRLGPQEIRANSRSTKKVQRDIRRAKIKAAKKKGILTPELRKQYKAEEADAELADFEAAAKNQSTSMASGKGRNESLVTGQRERNQGKDTPEEQTAEFKRKARIKARKDKEAEDKNITTSETTSRQSDNAVSTPGVLSNMAEEAGTTDFSTGYTPFTGGSGLNMVSSVAKRSPYKMKGHPGKR